MKLWTIGIALFVGISCASSNDGYEVKRFHIQSRQLDGKPQCVEIRRKRSTREADYIEQIDIQPSSFPQAGLSAQQKSIVDEEARGDNLNDIVIKRSDLAESSAILIVKSPSSPKVPLVFAIRPFSGNPKNNKNLKIQIYDDYSFSDGDKINEDFGDTSDEVQVIDDDDDDDFEDYSETYRESDSPKQQIQDSKKSKQKQSVHSKSVESGEDSMELIEKPKKQLTKSETNKNRNKLRIQALREYLSHNRENYWNTVQVLRDLRNNDDGRSVSPANCIVIEKEEELQQPANEKSAEGLDAGGRLSNKSYGLRKRYKGKRRQFE